MTFNIKDVTNNKDLGNIEVPYIKGHDGIDKYNEIKSNRVYFLNFIWYNFNKNW